MPVRNWFPTRIYDAPLVARGDKLRRALLAESYAYRDMDEAGQEWSAEHYPGGYTSYGSLSKLHRISPTFEDLERELRRHVATFARALDFDLTGRTLEMTDCWVSIMERHGAHGLHLHPTSTISGTYYVKTPRGCSSLKFEDPRLSRFMAAPPRKPKPRDANRTFVHYPAEAGRVLLFESWLRHEVASSRVKGERVAISFNWNWF